MTCWQHSGWGMSKRKPGMWPATLRRAVGVAVCAFLRAPMISVGCMRPEHHTSDEAGRRGPARVRAGQFRGKPGQNSTTKGLEPPNGFCCAVASAKMAAFLTLEKTAYASPGWSWAAGPMCRLSTVTPCFVHSARSPASPKATGKLLRYKQLSARQMGPPLMATGVSTVGRG